MDARTEMQFAIQKETVLTILKVGLKSTKRTETKLTKRKLSKLQGGPMLKLKDTSTG